jgi:hypothetical protein
MAALAFGRACFPRGAGNEQLVNCVKLADRIACQTVRLYRGNGDMKSRPRQLTTATPIEAPIHAYLITRSYDDLNINANNRVLMSAGTVTHQLPAYEIYVKDPQEIYIF